MQDETCSPVHPSLGSTEIEQKSHQLFQTYALEKPIHSRSEMHRTRNNNTRPQPYLCVHSNHPTNLDFGQATEWFGHAVDATNTVDSGKIDGQGTWMREHSRWFRL